MASRKLTMQEPDTLYYDGSCPLCQREMSHLAKLKSDQLVLQDIHALPPGAEGPDKETLHSVIELEHPRAVRVPTVKERIDLKGGAPEAASTCGRHAGAAAADRGQASNFG